MWVAVRKVFAGSCNHEGNQIHNLGKSSGHHVSYMIVLALICKYLMISFPTKFQTRVHLLSVIISQIRETLQSGRWECW